jgi:4,5-DOPA dioxygenase extradiol
MSNLIELNDSGIRMPAMFVGHGSPTNAIDNNEFSEAWAEIGESLLKPKAILCISAHWVTDGTRVTAMKQPKTIHDFYGFPQNLYEMQYPAEGLPELARLTEQTIQKTHVQMDFDWGLDHGAWSVLCRMFPNADIPVVQLSLDLNKEPEFHYELGMQLKALRDKGVLILGSGNIVHNLMTLVWQDTAYDWALEFDEKMKQLILSGDHSSIIHYKKFGKAASLSVPTNEHFLPLLYVLAMQDTEDQISFFAERVTLGSISMRSIKIG